MSSTSALLSSAAESLAPTATTPALSSDASPTPLSSFLESASSALLQASSLSESAASAIVTATATGDSAAHAVASERPASYKIIGVVLAILSGVFIGSSFVFKKKGLLSMQNKPGFVAGEGHAYLRSPMWWTGMSLMVIGEICNFVAYAFTDAILVTPMGALSVVICAILSSIFLKEKLTFFGKIGCALCIIGAVVIALNGPSASAAATIPEFLKSFINPLFLSWLSIVTVVSLGLIFWAAPRYGKKNMLVYVFICSLIGGISVVCTSGLGASILTSINGNNQFKHWFAYVLLVIVVITLLAEINYLNKALELFNTSMVTPCYFVVFTSATLLSDVLLHKGFKAPPEKIVTLVFGFLTICCGIVLLQMSKLDPEDLAQKVNLDRRTTMLLKAADQAELAHGANGEVRGEKGDTRNLDLEDPGVDTIRGFAGLAGSVHRAISARRTISRRRSQASRMTQIRSRHGHGGRGHRQSDSFGIEGSDGSEDEYSIDENGHIVDGKWRTRRSLRAGNGHGYSKGFSVQGDDGIVRHQLYDAPMPSDAADKISQYSRSDAGAGPSPTATSFATHGHQYHHQQRNAGHEPRSPTAIHFEEEVIEHRYPGKGEAGSILHQPHQPPGGANAHLYPHAGSSSTSASGPSELGEMRSNASIIDAHAAPGAAATARPAPAVRVQNGSIQGSGHGGRSGTVSTKTSSRSAGTGSSGGVSRGLSKFGRTDDNRSLSTMIQEHFAADTASSASTRSRSRSRERGQGHGATGIFASMRGGGRRAAHDEDGDGDGESVGLVEHGAEFAGSYSDFGAARARERADQQAGGVTSTPRDSRDLEEADAYARPDDSFDADRTTDGRQQDRYSLDEREGSPDFAFPHRRL